MADNVSIREAAEMDRAFMLSLSPILAGVAQFSWHSPSVIERFQIEYIEEMLDDKHVDKATYIAEHNNIPVGFVHVRSDKDEISGELRGTIPLLAVTKDAQGLGIGKRLIRECECWAKLKNFRLLHLEVFSTNQHAREFYKAMSFKEESINLIKEIE